MSSSSAEPPVAPSAPPLTPPPAIPPPPAAPPPRTRAGAGAGAGTRAGAGAAAGSGARAGAGDERRWHYRRSLASRVTLLTTMAVGLAVAFVAMGAYVTVRMQLQSTLDESLLERAESASLKLCNPGSSVPSDYFGATDVWAVCFNGPVYVTSDRLPSIRLGQDEAAVITGHRSSSIRTIASTNDSTQWRVAAVNRGGGRTVLVAQALGSQTTVLRRLGWVMLLFGAAGVVAAAMAGWGVARNGLRPVRRLTSSVEHIARTEDLTPLPVEGDDEVARLATAFNQMLTALAASRDRQRQLVADAGHELRTPLTSLRTNLDLLAQADGAGSSGSGYVLPAEARAELLDDVRAQIEELTTLIGDLVELARDEPLAHVVEPVDLAEVADRAVARVRRRAPGVRFEVHTSPWWVVGEPAALERAVTNLLDNAAKWSPADGTVRLGLVDGVLTVDDEGPGIAEADLPHVFERFYRSEESRAMPGSGLGLSIVSAVVARHSGTVEAGSSPTGGTRISVRLPGRATTPGPSYDADATQPINATRR